MNANLPAERQGTGTSPPAPAVLRVVAPLPDDPSRDGATKARILFHLGEPPRGASSFLSADRWSWGALRWVIGGRGRSAEFRRLVDELIAEGKVVEVREARVDGWRWRHQHVLVLAERFDRVAWHRLVEVVGREDVLMGLGIEG